MTRNITKKTISSAKSHLENNWPLRQSESHWAGGDHRVTLSKGKKPNCEGWSERVWSKNGKWSGNNSHVSLTATRAAFLSFPTLTASDGAIILDCEDMGNREMRIVYAKQSRGFDIVPAGGWLIRGYLSTKKTITAARIEAYEARKKAVALAMKRRQENVDFRRVWVSVHDSIAAGNCKSMTEQVEAQVKRIYGNVGGVRADILLNIRDDIYSRRAITAAQNR